MRKLLGLALAFMLTVSAYSAEITSTKDGGNWSNPASWNGGKVPTKDDDVTITSKIIADRIFESKTITIKENADLILDTRQDDAKCVVQRLTNYGTLRLTKHSSLYAPDINNIGTIENEGTIDTGK